MGFVFFYQEDKVLNYLLQGLQIEIPNKTATSSFLSSSRPVSGAHELEIKLSTVAPGEVIWARPAPAAERRGRAVAGGPEQTLVGMEEREMEVGRTKACLLWVWNKRGPTKGDSS